MVYEILYQNKQWIFDLKIIFPFCNGPWKDIWKLTKNTLIKIFLRLGSTIRNNSNFSESSFLSYISRYVVWPTIAWAISVSWIRLARIKKYDLKVWRDMWCLLVDSYFSINPARSLDLAYPLGNNIPRTKLPLYLAKASISVIDAWSVVEFVANTRSLLFNVSRYGLRKNSASFETNVVCAVLVFVNWAGISILILFV